MTARVSYIASAPGPACIRLIRVALGRMSYLPCGRLPPHIRGVSTQAPNGASRAVGTHHGPTRIHMADYRLRHRRDGNAGTTILYHPRIYRCQHSSSDDCGPPGAVGGWAPPLLPPGRQDLPRDYGQDGAAGGLSRSTSRRADDTTTRLRERADASVRRPGLGARLLATSDEARAGWYIVFGHI